MRFKYDFSRLTTAFLFLLAVNSTTSADVTLSYSTGNKTYFSFSVPDNWKINVGFEIDPSKIPEGELPKPRMISAMPNDKSPLWFSLWVPNTVSNIEEAKDYLASFRGYLVDKPVTKKIEKSETNGMQTLVAFGSGEKNGETVDVVVVILQVSSENVAIAVYIGPPTSTKKHGADLKYLVKSIQPIG